MLINLLMKMEPYLQEGQLITFRTLLDHEKEVFENLHRKVSVPPSACAIYMPPSVRHHMLYHRPEGEPQTLPEHSADNPPDEGIVLAGVRGNFNVIVNALLAKPPFTPAIDVYEDGQLLAGYVYDAIDECIGELTKVLRIHLHPGPEKDKNVYRL